MNSELLKTERLQRVLMARLESLQQAGVMQLPKPSRAIANVLADTMKASELPTGTPAEVTSTPSDKLMAVQRKKPSTAAPAELFQVEKPVRGDMDSVPTLTILRENVADCTRCSELATTRNQTVFGVGNPEARLCFLGEAPGADEDRLGEPFVGRAGQLLTKIIEACHLKREDVYILNMIKCRPPGNRNPLPTELSNCRGYLDRQFELIDPEFICCCGAVAAQNLLNTTVSIGKLRGKIHNYHGIKVVCTYHPAFLLRSPSFKKETWEDMKFLMREMGTPIE